MKRQFTAGAPNRLWVADFTYVGDPPPPIQHRIDMTEIKVRIGVGQSLAKFCLELFALGRCEFQQRRSDSRPATLDLCCCGHQLSIHPARSQDATHGVTRLLGAVQAPRGDVSRRWRRSCSSSSASATLVSHRCLTPTASRNRVGDRSAHSGPATTRLNVSVKVEGGADGVGKLGLLRGKQVTDVPTQNGLGHRDDVVAADYTVVIESVGQPDWNLVDRPRIVLVMGATVTRLRCGRTSSRVKIRTGRTLSRRAV